MAFEEPSGGRMPQHAFLYNNLPSAPRRPLCGRHSPQNVAPVIVCAASFLAIAIPLPSGREQPSVASVPACNGLDVHTAAFLVSARSRFEFHAHRAPMHVLGVA